MVWGQADVVYACWWEVWLDADACIRGVYVWFAPMCSLSVSPPLVSGGGYVFQINPIFESI